MGDELGVFVPPAVGDVGIALGELDQGNGHDAGGIEPWPAFTPTGVRRGADRHEVGGRVIVEQPDIPGARGCQVGAPLDVRELSLVEPLGRWGHAATAWRSTKTPRSKRAPARTSA